MAEEEDAILYGVILLMDLDLALVANMKESARILSSTMRILTSTKGNL